MSLRLRAVLTFCLGVVLINLRTNRLLGQINEVVVNDAPQLQQNDIRASQDDRCIQMSPGFDFANWPDIRYHKDQHDGPILMDRGFDHSFDGRKFSSVEEEDAQARATVAELNMIRSSVLTQELLDSGFTHGDKFRAAKFAIRLMESSIGAGHPLTIAVFGSSFTSGSSCAESSSQFEHHCSWPNRLSRRWMEVVAPLFCNQKNISLCQVNWKMFQHGSQGSVNIAQKLHAILHDEFSDFAPDAILLDNSIIDFNVNEIKKPWFEAVVRALIERYPRAMIVSLIDAIPSLIDTKTRRSVQFVDRLHAIQKHYGMVSVDLARMVRHLAHNNSIDLLWPQSRQLIASNGTKVPDQNNMAHLFSAVYWDTFLPRVQMIKGGHHPQVHPPWPTHQLVADIVLYSLLRVVELGLGCTNDDITVASLPIDGTVASKEMIDDCFICFDPISQFDAKSPRYSKDNDIIKNNGNSMIETCGDFEWKIDDRHRSGWQSDNFGSLIRFRLRLSEERPFLSMTYMTSHSTFGSLQITFQTVEREDGQPFIRCDNIQSNIKTLPWFEFSGSRKLYSIWETFAFSTEPPLHGQPPARRAWDVFNKTVLTQENAKYVDLYVYNPNESGSSRIKIQTVTSC